MDVFNLRKTLIEDYASYIRSFVTIQDKYIEEHVNRELNAGALWPDPLLQLNPNFEPGAKIDQLASDGKLNALASKIFRTDKDKTPQGKGMLLYKHQTDALAAAQTGDNYVLTTGTGSGKSLAYIVPIVNHVLRRGSGKGIQAVIIYPMNALANSQEKELGKFLNFGFAEPSVTFRRYTGQEKDEERREIVNNPPDILLTNYVMLELVMTRPEERDLVRAMRGLQFLVLDELHTYRGRQGADVAMLIRRVRNISENSHLQVVGTSATLAGHGRFTEQQVQVAEVASRLFGAPVKPERVIGETLRRVTPDTALTDPLFIEILTKRIARGQASPTDYTSFVDDPLSTWIETIFGLKQEEETGRLKRAEPLSIEVAAKRLADTTRLSQEACEAAIKATLMNGYQVLDPDTGLPVFAFRLHQFISRGDTVYASLDDPSIRYLTLNGQKYVPNDRDKILLPLAFCRECGQEYYVVRRFTDPQTRSTVVIPRDLRDQAREEDNENGFLYHSLDNPWNDDEEELITRERLPEDWLEIGADNEYRVKRDQRKKLPQRMKINTRGESDPQGQPYHFVQSPFPFCLNCGVAYSSRERTDFGKLSGLSSEGRSTATTILSLSAYRTLKHDAVLEQKAKKLLSFTDNRQDASLQAGHFNDFVEVGLLRAALYRAVAEAGVEGLSHDQLALRVFETLGLPFDLYADNTESENRTTRRRTDEALRQILAYRLYIDLRRGWRLTAPNLEQCGLLTIEYPDLQAVAEDGSIWQGHHAALQTAAPETRVQVCKALLDLLRRELAIRTDVLDAAKQESIRQNSFLRLCEPWAIDDTEQMTASRVAIPGPRRLRDNNSGDYLAVSSRSGFGNFLRRHSTLPNYDGILNLEETDKIITDLFAILTHEGLIEIVEEPKDKDDVAGYQLPADVMVWKAGDGAKPFYDPVRVRRQSSAEVKTNQFFVAFYQDIAIDLQGLEAREHTAQVPSAERENRENEFREATLPVLFCSPTMELGVDISQLNVVNMRNVPPTPANYAQRSGRAGRSGQPALVFTYCTSGSPHDQYFYKRPSLMVAGSVTPPRLDLANEDLIRTHVHAVWLAETGQSLHSSLAQLLVLEGEPPPLTLQESIQRELERDLPRRTAHRRLEEIFAGMAEEMKHATWFTNDWVEKTLNQTLFHFNEACERWRSLYRSAIQQRDTQHAIITDASRAKTDKDQATRLRQEAENQIILLTDSRNVVQSDFYSYRYFASEGFLPGYNFPRLPLSAFIPARRGSRRKDQDEYLSRPRFLAISEFGPRSIIYHEGSRYIINKVILPVGEANFNNGTTVFTTTAKVCPKCGYLHHLPHGVDNLEFCEFCQEWLDIPIRSLFRMQNVSTRRRDRINSDEEERVRMGYELQTSVRFEERNGRPAFATAQVKSADGQDLLTLTYGDTATLWRINKGWRRRKDKHDLGFVLDVERGYWSKNEQEVENDPEEQASVRKEKVIPYVEDRRNSLLIEFAEKYSVEVMASLQPALKSAIQVLYQLEDSELAAEPLPTRDERRMIVIYESAEGGAGVLRQMVTDQEVIRKVARKALELCHFDPDTRADKRRAEHAKEDCEAACYDCLMSYFNQPDHQLLDRKLVLTPLYELMNGEVQISPTRLERSDQLAELKAQCDSELERTWLDFLNERNLRLPDSAQRLIEQCNTRCDFYYSDKAVAVYIDGPPHDYNNVAAADSEVNDCLALDLGLTVLRFRHDQRARWEEIVADHAYVFGKVHG